MAQDNTVEIEVWVVVDEAGDCGVGADQDAAVEDFDANVGGSAARRTVRVILTVPLPAPITLRGTVPAEANEGAALEVA